MKRKIFIRKYNRGPYFNRFNEENVIQILSQHDFSKVPTKLYKIIK